MVRNEVAVVVIADVVFFFCCVVLVVARIVCHLIKVTLLQGFPAFVPWSSFFFFLQSPFTTQLCATLTSQPKQAWIVVPLAALFIGTSILRKQNSTTSPKDVLLFVLLCFAQSPLSSFVSGSMRCCRLFSCSRYIENKAVRSFVCFFIPFRSLYKSRRAHGRRLWT